MRRRKPDDAIVAQRVSAADAKPELATCHIYKAIDDIVTKIVTNLFRDYFLTWFSKIADERDAEKVRLMFKNHWFKI